MSFSAIALISSSISQLANAIATIPSLIVKHLFNDTSNSTDSSYTDLTLLNTNGFLTDGTVKTINSTGSSIGNYITNYINLTRASAPGVTIMFRMKLTTSVSYSTSNNRFTVFRSRAEAIEDGFFTLSLYNNSGTIPNMIFEVWTSPVSGAGNNKLISRYGLIGSANFSYDNTFHHFCFTITETNSTGNYFVMQPYRNGTAIGTPVANNGSTDADHFSRFLTMKRIEFFPPSFNITGSPTVITFPPATCRIADFRIYNRVLNTTEINTCRTGGEVSS